MVQGGLPPSQWPDHTRRFLRAESTIRRTSGAHAPAVKAPFMPSLAIALDAFLRQRTGSVLIQSLKPLPQRCCCHTCLVGEPLPQMSYVKKIVHIWANFVFFDFRKPSGKALLLMKDFFASWTCKHMCYRGLPIFYILFCCLLRLTQGFYICFQKTKACKWPCSCCKISCFR